MGGFRLLLLQGALFSLVTLRGRGEVCPSEENALVAFKQQAESEPFDRVELENAITRGWFDLAGQIIRRAHAQSRDVSSSVRAAVQTVKNKADELIRLLNKDAETIQVMSPAFQWAQSADSIFLNIKFSFRWSAPGALSVENEVIEANGSSFYFAGIGTHSHVKKKYELKLDLFSEVDSKVVEWSFGSVGKLTVTLRKREKRKWKRLLKDANQKISNMSVWWDMKEKYASEVDRLGEDAEDAAKDSGKTSVGKSSSEEEKKSAEGSSKGGDSAGEEEEEDLSGDSDEEEEKAKAASKTNAKEEL
uniref:CS domain-containing protein n=1 Tax=Chromera velia CCMP2878 TaxID=1169474 RepID=A0A0G4F358_9ALVE|mmetsp:Transcript_33010/g.65401  ORF Transcript_33010/g.65401 Transcript_33010/m.65401 type:complete len:304 (+) Transcript_33010:134-1045(+)|eukprot:Cvel_14820.t1-p1 / transcript=Cvel_14820.t1 / gene=Cvel_14820 / organism=Chromera_velia_CCMP2878 / gene_product=hypothetical protein / transcript_product=hypothetical protein / location=Cvel_scaffold1069:27556-34487(-) / protein_length=303 / sequence_SO=supercontig / SO=protein_coding / is_pseudo=false